MKLTEQEKQIIQDYGEICKRWEEIDPNNEFIWRGIFIGFAIGCGLSIENAVRWQLYEEAFKKERLI